MGIVIHQYLSPHSFVMGVVWFNAFVVLGLTMRKLKYPVKFSVVPLVLLLVLSVMRMFLAIELPGAVVVLSESFYPTIIEFSKIDFLPFRVFGFPVNIANTFALIWFTVTIWLAVRYIYRYYSNFRSILKWMGSFDRDAYAESLLREIIGEDKHFRVYRSKAFRMAVATAFKPYIILPEVKFSPDELRVILLHEWKHIQDKDYLTSIIVNVICFVFWWNPLVYVLRWNFFFAQELKSDQFAVSDRKDFKHYLNGLRLLNSTKKNDGMDYGLAKAFIGDDGDGLADRLKILALKDDSHKKRLLTNVLYSVMFVALFIASYAFTVLPAFWESPDVSPYTGNFIWEYSNPGDVFRIDENFLLCNGDGTFSLYADGHFVSYVDDISELVNWVPIRTRETD